MNIRNTLIVLVLAVVAGIVAIIKLKTPPTPVTEASLAGTRLLDPSLFDPDKVTRIAIDRADGERIVFEKTGDDWWQTEPARFQMVTWSIRMLATSAADLTISRTIAKNDLKGDQSAEKLGLAPPMGIVTYDTSDAPFRIELGRISVGETAYARLAPDGDVYLVEDKLHRRLFDSSPREWRLKNIFRNIQSDVSRISIERSEPGKTISLVRMNGRWRLALPIETAADESAVTRLVGSLGSMQAESFIEDHPKNLADYALDRPWATITAETDRVDQDGKTTTARESVLLGSPFDMRDAARYAKTSDQASIVKLRASDVQALTPEPSTLVSRTVVILPRQDIRVLVVDGQEGRFRIERQLEDWILTLDDGSTAPAKTEAVRQLLDQLTLPCQSVTIGVKGAPVDGQFLGKVSVEGFSHNTVADVTWYRRPQGDAADVVFADGSGALRSRPMMNVPELVPGTFSAATPSGGGNAGGPNDPEPMK